MSRTLSCPVSSVVSVRRGRKRVGTEGRSPLCVYEDVPSFGVGGSSRWKGRTRVVGSGPEGLSDVCTGSGYRPAPDDPETLTRALCYHPPSDVTPTSGYGPSPGSGGARLGRGRDGTTGDCRRDPYSDLTHTIVVFLRTRRSVPSPTRRDVIKTFTTLPSFPLFMNFIVAHHEPNFNLFLKVFCSYSTLTSSAGLLDLTVGDSHLGPEALCDARPLVAFRVRLYIVCIRSCK